MDHMSPGKRSALMARIRGTDTRPEQRVRSVAHRLGFRFRLHVRGLPGRPDLVFPRLRKIILVHGCFWHQHDCPRGTRPASNVAFWTEKLDRNQARDRTVLRQLRRQGWRVIVIWECQTNDPARLSRRLGRFLSAVH